MMRQLAEETRRASQNMADQALELAWHRVAGLNAMHFGEIVEARSAFETILQIYDPSRHRPPPVHYIHDPKFYAVAYLPVIYWILGYPEQARIGQAKAFEYASELNQATLTAHVRIYCGAGLGELLFDTATVGSHADAIVDLAEQHDLRYFRLSGLILRGWAAARRGVGEEGLELMRRSATERLAMGVSWYQIRYLCMLAEASLRLDNREECSSALAEARDLMARTDERMWEAETLRLEGELRRRQGGPRAEVEDRLQEALAVARGQSAKSFELRAAVSLGRLWRDEGNHAKARDLLAPIYGWFTEGFDTPDLAEARSLLEEL